MLSISVFTLMMNCQIVFCRAADNWRCLKELEKAAKVYWSCKDRLPPRVLSLSLSLIVCLINKYCHATKDGNTFGIISCRR
jgi:hypothetical protein